MLKKLAATIMIAAGLSWATLSASASADSKPEVKAKADVDTSVVVRTYDLHKSSDWCSLLTLILGLDLDLDADL